MDEDLCQHGKPWPCPYCAFEWQVFEAELMDDTLYSVTNTESCDSIDE